MSESRAPLGQLPRRQALAVQHRSTYPPQMKRNVPPRISSFQVFLRFLAWLAAGVRFGVRQQWDGMRGRGTPRQRGVRLRQMFEEMGGTAIKIGQQLSVRVDLLSFEVCDELSKLMDDVPPFDVDHALEKIEATCGRPLAEVFAVFDPDPIGSASIACVYQAVLKETGERVAVKVRRPQVARLFALDLRCLDWLTYLPETFALVPPGNFKYLRTEMRSMLQEELDFDDEARYQRLFRRLTRKHKIRWLTAPKVFHQFSGPEVLVSEHVSGLSCKELLDAVESGDPVLARQLRQMNVRPKKIARRLYQTFLFGFFEAPFFHADPHPANIVLRPGNRLVLLDFGSCGSMSQDYILSYEAMMSRMTAGDISGMADASLRMMAPLPHVNVHELKKRIEFLYRRHLRAVEDKKAAWWERTSTAMWLAMMEAVREINLPMNLDAVRISRASMLYDTVIYRLNAKFEVRREYGRYRRQAAKRAVRQIRKQQRRAAGRSQRHLAIKEQHDRMSRLQYMAYQAESAFSQMPYQFAAVVKKGAYAARMGLRFLITVTVVAVGISLGVYGYHAVTGKNISDLHPLTVLEHYVWTHPLSLTLLAVPLWILIRRLLFRLGEVDVTPGD